jgi:hypothetical protein
VTALREIIADVSGFPCAAQKGGGEADSLTKAVQSLLDQIERKRPGCPISLSTIQDFSMEIQHTLDCEQKYLEVEISSLTSSLDSETDTFAGRPYTGSSVRSADSHGSDGPLQREGERHAGAGGAGLSPSKRENSSNKTSKVRSRLPCKSVTSAYASTSPTNLHDEAIHDSVAPTNGSSKFRNRLQAAKDENYFIDEFELGLS